MENIISFCIAWLTDSVFAIREAACKLMKKLYDIYKGEEFEKKIIEHLNEMRINNSYLIRNTVLFLAKVNFCFLLYFLFYKSQFLVYFFIK